MNTSFSKTFLTLMLGFGWVFSAQGQFAGPHIVAEGVNGQYRHLYADFDGDGSVDLLTDGFPGLRWHKNNGNGSFGPLQEIPNSGTGYGEIKAIDLDGNGTVDLIYPKYVGGLAWQSNDGTGNFSPPVDVSTDYIQRYDVADIDGDGDKDIALDGDFGTGIWNLYWLENTGGGNFSTVHIVTPNITCCFSRIHLADLTGDNHPDLVTIEDYPNPIYYRVNDGSGNFGPAIFLVQNPELPNWLESTDADQDGDLDLLIVGGSQVGVQLSWLINLGAGAFGTSQVPIFTGDGNQTYISNSQVVIADFSGDGVQDIVGYGTYNGTGQRLMKFINKNDGTGAFDFLETASDLPGFYTEPKAADVDGDGAIDLSALLENSLFTARNTGGGAFDPFIVRFTNWFHVNSMDVADLDGDASADFFAATNTVDGALSYFANDGLGHFAPNEYITNYFTTSGNGITGDVDLDGDIDLVANSGYLDQLVLYRNAGGGTFNGPITISTSRRPLYLCKVDNDADLDLVVRDLTTGTFGWMTNNGAGVFSAYQSFGLQHQEYRISLPADLDGDGDADVAAATFSDQYWYANDGNGNFTSNTYVGTQAFSQIAVASDIDGDNDADLLCGGNQLQWYENLGSGVFNSTAHVITTSLPTFTVQSRVADLDNDGDNDVLIYTGTDTLTGPIQLHWFENLGAGAFGPANAFGTVQFYLDCKFNDLDGDGDLDIAYRSSEGLGWYENLSGMSFIQGSCFRDVNENGAWDAGEPPLYKVALSLSPSGLATYVNSAGDFRFYVGPGNYTLSYVPDDCFTLSTPSPTFNVNFTGTTITGPVFGFKKNLTDRHVKPQLSSNFPRCDSDVNFWITLDNNSCNDAAGKVALVLDNLTTFVSASPNIFAMSGDTIWWNYDTVAAGSTGLFQVTLHVADASHVGDTIHLRGFTWLDQPNGSYTLADSGAYWTVIRCSFDPNDKTVDRSSVPFNYVPEEKELVYTIRFQNTGNDTAFTVRLRDTLSPDLDWATLRPLGSSSPYYVVLNTVTGLLQFVFDNINLTDTLTNEPGSHGFVHYAIQLKPGLPPGTLVHNRAGIYFDANPPVMTNTAETLVSLQSATYAPLRAPWMVVQPNPTLDLCTIQFEQPVGKGALLTLTDVHGRNLKQIPLSAGIQEQNVSLEGLPAGIYLMRLTQYKVSESIVKIIKL